MEGNRPAVAFTYMWCSVRHGEVVEGRKVALLKRPKLSKWPMNGSHRLHTWGWRAGARSAWPENGNRAKGGNRIAPAPRPLE